MASASDKNRVRESRQANSAQHLEDAVCAGQKRWFQIVKKVELSHDDEFFLFSFLDREIVAAIQAGFEAGLEQEKAAALKTQAQSKRQRSLREIPSFFIMAFKVVRGMPRRVAVALTTPPVSRKTRRM
jgi:hypothetical protein